MPYPEINQRIKILYIVNLLQNICKDRRILRFSWKSVKVTITLVEDLEW